jgi:flavin-dependent dehydrogenase
MDDVSYDAIVIGCGPGGSSAATFLAKAGRRVLVVEKEKFPRFHVGESLLPYNRALFEELGVWPALAAVGFPRKFGAQFHLANGTKTTRFEFRNGCFTRETEAIQVERAKFDHLLMENARRCGVEVREGWTVRRFASDADGVSVEAVDVDGKQHSLRAKFLLDASGRANITGNQEGLRENHPKHRKYAVYGHFTGVARDAGEPGGDTVIVRDADRWFWLIPVSGEKTSVGLVLDKRALEAEGGDAEAAFHRAVANSAVMRQRMAKAQVVGGIKTTADFSYFNRRLVGPRVVRLGDAAGFMDPIFSAGVYLAMWSGKLAAEATAAALAAGNDGHRKLARYERRLNKAMRVYWRLVEHYYTTPFMELFLEPRPTLQTPAAVVAVLAGDLEPAWHIRWRLEFFYLLVWLQGKRTLVPRISFAPDPPLGHETPASSS